MSTIVSDQQVTNLASYIDHTILAPQATVADVERICHEAIEHEFCSVCVNPIHIPLVAKLLKASSVLTCSVIGFPLGAIPTHLKCEEAKWVIEQGAQEVDMVISVGHLKQGDTDYVLKDIAAVKDACGPVTLKVIIETCLLSDEEKKIACQLSKDAGADFVKTSTGFMSGGATAHDIALMRAVVGPEMGVKASGGVRSRDNALEMIKAGASRLGASASISIVSG
ncbi:deoxyribose-phosphate aldolase [Cohaesibacter celericrescens]|uniref:Deoxyribose-phosphate aldolase n=1 Tax=Cohaesibacter celericrescens TaxID=2067669 RepID=A0A2N5XW88_9HYPH|nr:deoxyribose-phosphate aldolase [Cohaesibacter celericrescens]PLW78749.1 deoxyribose-phosphate aldolase [Cohaesibacter celericrescens]